MSRRLVWVALLLSVGSYSSAGFGHHSVAGFFDPNTDVELDGIVTATIWRNPHTVFEIDVEDDSENVTTWRIETGALGVLRARGLDRAFIQVGDRVRVFGDASLRGRAEIFARNLLLTNGREVLLTVGSTPYFSTRGGAGLLEAVYDSEVEAAARRDANGVFRVWSTDIEELPTSGARMFHGNYPMTSATRETQAQWDTSNEVLLGCTDWNMPRLMSNPLPIEFVDQGDRILMRFEEDDNERLIHMQAGADSATSDASLLGYSTGRWDGNALVVETTNLSPGNMDSRGTPFSAQIHLLERFSPTADGSRLNYQLTITDPESFLEPFTVERYWIWRPEIAVGSYSCEQEQQLR